MNPKRRVPAAQSDRQAPHARRHLQRARGGRTHATGVTTTTTTASRAAGREQDGGVSQKNVSGRGVYLAERGWVAQRDTKALREKCGGEASMAQRQGGVQRWHPARGENRRPVRVGQRGQCSPRAHGVWCVGGVAALVVADVGAGRRRWPRVCSQKAREPPGVCMRARADCCRVPAESHQSPSGSSQEGWNKGAAAAGEQNRADRENKN